MNIQASLCLLRYGHMVMQLCAGTILKLLLMVLSVTLKHLRFNCQSLNNNLFNAWNDYIHISACLLVVRLHVDVELLWRCLCVLAQLCYHMNKHVRLKMNTNVSIKFSFLINFMFVLVWQQILFLAYVCFSGNRDCYDRADIQPEPSCHSWSRNLCSR